MNQQVHKIVNSIELWENERYMQIANGGIPEDIEIFVIDKTLIYVI